MIHTDGNQTVADNTGRTLRLKRELAQELAETPIPVGSDNAALGSIGPNYRVIQLGPDERGDD